MQWNIIRLQNAVIDEWNEGTTYEVMPYIENANNY